MCKKCVVLPYKNFPLGLPHWINWKCKHCDNTETNNYHIYDAPNDRYENDISKYHRAKGIPPNYPRRELTFIESLNPDIKADSESINTFCSNCHSSLPSSLNWLVMPVIDSMALHATRIKNDSEDVSCAICQSDDLRPVTFNSHFNNHTKICFACYHAERWITYTMGWSSTSHMHKDYAEKHGALVTDSLIPSFGGPALLNDRQLSSLTDTNSLIDLLTIGLVSSHNCRVMNVVAKLLTPTLGFMKKSYFSKFEKSMGDFIFDMTEHYPQLWDKIQNIGLWKLSTDRVSASDMNFETKITSVMNSKEFGYESSIYDNHFQYIGDWEFQKARSKSHGTTKWMAHDDKIKYSLLSTNVFIEWLTAERVDMGSIVKPTKTAGISFKDWVSLVRISMKQADSLVWIMRMMRETIITDIMRDITQKDVWHNDIWRYLRLEMSKRNKGQVTQWMVGIEKEVNKELEIADFDYEKFFSLTNKT